MKKAIIIGASSGIGRALALALAKDGYAVGLVARRADLLAELKEEIGAAAVLRVVDVTQIGDNLGLIKELAKELGGLDLVVLNAGVGHINKDLDWEKEKDAIDVNVTGFTALAGAAYKYFEEQGHGHIVGISSVVALRGIGASPAYSASKAFISNYLQGLRQKGAKAKLDIAITDIKPGFVDTKMAKGATTFWMASPELAAHQILQAIIRKKSHAYVTRRWRLIGWLFKILPDCIYNKI